MQKQCHQPCRNGRNNNDNDRIGQPLQPGTHIQLGKVNSACNKRKTRNDKKHGTDISRLMLQGNPGNQLCDPKQNGIGNARRGNGCHNPEKQCQMMLCQFAADKVSKSCPAKSKQHFHGSSAKQKCECAACQCRGKSQSHRGIESMNPVDLIQMIMELFARHCFPYG